MSVSVVICTSREGSLAPMLGPLTSELPSSAEVVIVRSGIASASVPLPNDVVTWVGTAPCSVVFATEPTLGVARARNLGLNTARSDLVLFLDDDVLVRPGWFKALTRSMDDPQVAIAGGSIVVRWPQGVPPTWLPPHMFGGYFGERDAGHTDAPPFAANMAVRRGVALAAGGFHPDLGVVGSKQGVHEEADLIRRLRAAGHAIGEAPEAVVEHLIRPEQVRYLWVLKRAWAFGSSDARIDGYRITLRPGKRVKSLKKVMRDFRSGHNRVGLLAQTVSDSAYLLGWLRCSLVGRGKKTLL